MVMTTHMFQQMNRKESEIDRLEDGFDVKCTAEHAAVPQAQTIKMSGTA